MLSMSCIFACFLSALLTCCVATAQAPAPVPPPAAPSPAQQNVTTSSSPEIQNFQKIEDTWANAVNQRDQYGLENVLSPLFVDVAANGDITTRNQQIVQVISGDDKSVWLTQKVITVRLLGDIAVANGTYTLHHNVNSKAVDEKGVFTHVFEKAHGGWVCINSQRTVLREDPSSKKKSNSTTAEPFHIPLFGGHGDKGPQ